MKTLLILMLMICATVIVKAQYPIEVQYQSILSTTPTMPAYSSSVEDTSVPDDITIRRITDYFSDWDWYPTHDYAKIQPWNADGTLYKIRALALYDATTLQEHRNLPGGQIYPVYWSNVNSNLMYSFREDGKVKKYSVDTEVLETTDTIVGYEIIKLGPGEGNIDKNDHYVALIGKRGLDMDVIVYDLQLNQIAYTEVFTGAWGAGTQVPDYVDWVSVSQSGDYVGIMWNHNITSISNPFNSHYGVELYNTTDMQYIRRIARYGNHGDFGYAANGDEVFVQFWGETGTINMYYLDRLERVVISSHSDFNSSGHISCRNLSRPGYAYVSQDYEDHSGQIVAIKLEESGFVEHFGHHYNSYTYFAAIPVPDPNGQKVMFTSDFGNNTDPDEIYVFESKKSISSGVNYFETASIKIYPNPVIDELNIISKTNIIEIKLYSTLGVLIRKVVEKETKAQLLDVSDLQTGFYFLKIKGINETVEIYKIVKK